MAKPGILIFAVRAGVRFHRVEELIDGVGPPHPMATLEGNKARSTLGRQLGQRLHGLFQKNWALSSLDDVEGVASEMESFIVQEGIPFLDKYSRIETALSALMKDDAEANGLMPIDEVRAKNAIALAFLMGGEVLAHDVIRSKVNYLRGLTHADSEGLRQWANNFIDRVQGQGGRA